MAEHIPAAQFILGACGAAETMAWWATDAAEFNEEWLRAFSLGQQLTQWKMQGIPAFGIHPDVTAFKSPPQSMIDRCVFPEDRWAGWNQPVMLAYCDLVLVVWKAIQQPCDTNSKHPAFNPSLITKVKTYAAVLRDAVQEHDYSEPQTPDDWAKVFGQSWKTIRRRIDAEPTNPNKIRALKMNGQSWRIHRGDIPAAAVR
jgi:hypothetical protein